MTHEQINRACEIYGGQAVLEASRKRIVDKDHKAFPAVGLPDTDKLIEAYGVMDVALNYLMYSAGEE